MAEIKEILKEHLEVIKAKIAQRMVSSKRNASGRSVASLTVSVDEASATLWGAKSFLVMEHGRGPGAVPMGFFDIIFNWVKAKGISIKVKDRSIQQNSEGALRSFAGAVAYTIMKKGTKLHRSKQYNDIYSTVIKEELDKMYDDLALSVFDQVTIINQE